MSEPPIDLGAERCFVAGVTQSSERRRTNRPLNEGFPHIALSCAKTGTLDKESAIEERDEFVNKLAGHPEVSELRHYLVDRQLPLEACHDRRDGSDKPERLGADTEGARHEEEFGRIHSLDAQIDREAEFRIVEWIGHRSLSIAYLGAHERPLNVPRTTSAIVIEPDLLTDAETRKYPTEYILGVGLSNDFSEGSDCGAHICAHDLDRRVSTEPLKGAVQRGAGFIKATSLPFICEGDPAVATVGAAVLDRRDKVGGESVESDPRFCGEVDDLFAPRCRSKLGWLKIYFVNEEPNSAG